MIKIEYNIPFTDGREIKICKYPWAKMEVGDSFAVHDVSRVTMSATISYEKRRTGKVYRCSAVDDHVRVWRIA